MKRLLLISNSTLHGSGYLDHCENEIKAFLGKSIKTVAFVPYARPSGISHDEYSNRASERIKRMGFEIKSVHSFNNPSYAIENADAIFIGGGNSFILLDGLYKNGLIETIRNKVLSGMPYIGTSAGSNVVCPTIMTTNDMPIRQLTSFNALNLFPYQINPHYLDPEPNSKHQGETRETRINEYHCFNDTPVIGLREGAIVLVENESIILRGLSGARVFRKYSQPLEFSPGESLANL